MKLLNLIFILSSLLISTFLYPQNGHRKGAHQHNGKHYPLAKRHVVGKRIVLKRSIYRPNRVAVYHPYWHRNYTCNRRWVYFPQYNFYWDNWRNHYVYYNGNTWFSQVATPPLLININLENEKHLELKENEDDIDDIYKTNETHKNENKIVE